MNRCLISSFISVKLKHDHRPRCNTCYQRQQVLHLASNSMLWLLGWRTEGHLNHFCSGHVHPKTGSAPGDRVRIKSRVLNQRPGPHPENTSAPRVGSAPRDRVLIQRPGPHPETGSSSRDRVHPFYSCNGTVPVPHLHTTDPDPIAATTVDAESPPA